MAEDAGLSSWADVGDHPVWIAGREVGTATGVTLSDTYPGGPSGVHTPAGHVHQSGGASPQAPTSADEQLSRTLTFTPQLDRITYEHFQALRATQRTGGLPKLWVPFPRVEAWKIRGVIRNTWTLGGIISGSAGVRALHVVPKVEIRDAGSEVVASTDPTNHPGASTLTIVAGTPATDTEIKIPTTTDTTALVTGDLTGDAGGSLVVHYFGLVTVQIVAINNEIEELNRMVTEVEFLESPEQRDFEADT